MARTRTDRTIKLHDASKKTESNCSSYKTGASLDMHVRIAVRVSKVRVRLMLKG